MDEDHQMNRFDYSNKFWEMADRSFNNFVEQTAHFIVMMWLTALFCNAQSAGSAGLWYVFFRALFPIFWAIKGQWNLLIELSTQPAYAVINYYYVSLLYVLFTGKQFRDEWMPGNPIAVVVVFFVLHIVCSLVIMPLGFALAAGLAKGFPEKEGLTDDVEITSGTLKE